MKRASERPSPVPGGAAIFQRLYTRLGCQGRPPRFEVEFYPYANLMHTIRVREETACVRLSDALRRAPDAISMAEPPTIPVNAPTIRPFQAFFMSFL